MMASMFFVTLFMYCFLGTVAEMAVIYPIYNFRLMHLWFNVSLIDGPGLSNAFQLQMVSFTIARAVVHANGVRQGAASDDSDGRNAASKFGYICRSIPMEYIKCSSQKFKVSSF